MKKTPVIGALLVFSLFIAALWLHSVAKKPGKQDISAIPVAETVSETQQIKGTVEHQNSINEEKLPVSDKPLNSPVRSLKSADLAEASRSDMLNADEHNDQDVEANNIDGFEDIKEVVQVDNQVITDYQAITIARKAIGPICFHEEGDITVERADSYIRVRFPVNKHTPPGTRYRGPDYAAEVEINAKTGEVLRSRLGG